MLEKTNPIVLSMNGGIMVGSPDRFINGNIGGFAYLPNGHLVVGSSKADEALRVIDLDRFVEVKRFSQQGYSADAIICLENGNIIVGSRDSNATLRIFNPNDGALIKSFSQEQRSISTSAQLKECMDLIERREQAAVAEACYISPNPDIPSAPLLASVLDVPTSKGKIQMRDNHASGNSIVAGVVGGDLPSTSDVKMHMSDNRASGNSIIAGFVGAAAPSNSRVRIQMSNNRASGNSVIAGVVGRQLSDNNYDIQISNCTVVSSTPKRTFEQKLSTASEPKLQSLFFKTEKKLAKAKRKGLTDKANKLEQKLDKIKEFQETTAFVKK